jgi:histidine triad (HIT) family protein
MLDSNLTGKDLYIEWLTGLAPAHKGRGGIRYRLLIFWTAATADLAGGMPTHVAPASILPADVACFICRIVAREAPASVVLEDQSTMAFVDIRQPNEGHILVVPRQHIETIDLLEGTIVADLAWSTVRVARAVRRAYRPPGMNVWESNGEAAGQEVPHVHFHVLPRHHGDGLLRVYPDANPHTFGPADPALERIAERVRRAMS